MSRNDRNVEARAAVIAALFHLLTIACMGILVWCIAPFWTQIPIPGQAAVCFVIAVTAWWFFNLIDEYREIKKGDDSTLGSPKKLSDK